MYLILVTLGKRMEMPLAVCISALLNSAPVISHTGDFLGSFTTKSGTIVLLA